MQVRRVIQIIGYGAAVCGGCVLLAASVLAVMGWQEKTFPADAAVVLGNEVYADGTCAPRLQGRLRRAALLYREGLCRVIIVSGGVGKSGYDEAVGMRAFLIQQGIPEASIVMDSSGSNSRATAHFTAQYLAGTQGGSVIVVTQFYHVPRCVMAMRQAGIIHVGAVHSNAYGMEDVFALLREVPAYAIYWLGVK